MSSSTSSLSLGRRSASMARRNWVSTRPPMARTPERMDSISASNCLDVCSFTLCSDTGIARASAKPAGDVILGFPALRFQEQIIGRAEFDQLAYVHVGSVVGNACCLLHVMGDDRDGVVG